MLWVINSFFLDYVYKFHSFMLSTIYYSALQNLDLISQ